MTFISYGQNFEDVLLWRALKHIENGFYIDVGANDPQDDSITRSFYDRGWHGINLEPLPAYHTLLCEQRTRDINLAVAAGANDGEVTLFDIPDVRGWATSDTTVANQHLASGLKVTPITVPMRTLSGIWKDYVTTTVHFLKVDVEGFEDEVIKGMDFKKFRPWIVIVEALLPNSTLSSHEKWEPRLLEANYAFAYFDGLNRYYVCAEHNELMTSFGLQPNVFDQFITTGEARATAAWVATKKSLAVINDAVLVTEKALGIANEALVANDQRLIHVTQAKADAENKLSLANEALVASDQKLAMLTNTMAEAEQQLVHVSEALFATEANLMRAVLGKQRERANVELAQAERARAVIEVQKAEAETQAARVMIAQLSDRVMQMERQHQEGLHVAHMRQLEINAIHATLSWRITRPLRIAKLLLKEPRNGWQKIRARLEPVRKDAKQWLARSIRWVQRQPRLMRLAVWALSRSPALDIKVREITARARHVDLPPADISVAPVLAEHLRSSSLSTRKVLADLQKAKRHNQH